MLACLNRPFFIFRFVVSLFTEGNAINNPYLNCANCVLNSKTCRIFGLY